MRIKVGIAVFLLCSNLGLGSHTADAETQQKMNTGYDGHWWLSISSSERSGFLNGYFDCYTYEFNGSARFTKNPPDTARSLVTKFYEENSAHLADPVSDVFYRFRNHTRENAMTGDGEPINGRHGYYDGTYWKQMSALGGKAEQLGFVEGYLWCHAHLLQNQGGIFSKAPAKYVVLISRWYKFNSETEDMDAKREPTKIADVFSKFREKKSGQSEYPR